jgi:hypothetical protein
MDLYGNDDADDDATIDERPSSSHLDHNNTFEELKLLEFVQSQRKVLQQRIHVGMVGNSCDDDEEIATWRQAVENAGAFVQYKTSKTTTTTTTTQYHAADMQCN